MKWLIVFSILIYSCTCQALIMGVGAHPNNFNGSADEFLSFVKKNHIASLRLDYSWSNVEKTKGVFTPPRGKIDEIVYKAKKYGIKLIIIVGGKNDLYTREVPSNPIEDKAFIDYINWVCKHFGDSVDTYEIWNEWSMQKPHDIWRNSESAKKYFQLVKISSKKIKEINPKIKVIAGSFNPTSPDDYAWGIDLIKLGILRYVDAISIHPYLYRGRGNLYDINVDLIPIIIFHKQAKKLARRDFDIYITENGIPTTKNTRFDNEQLCGYFKNYVSGIKTLHFIKGLWWYDLQDDGSNTLDDEDNFGIFKRDLSNKFCSKKIIEDFYK